MSDNTSLLDTIIACGNEPTEETPRATEDTLITDSRHSVATYRPGNGSRRTCHCAAEARIQSSAC
jgi:hypothetical protein